jgi:putative endonuclease
VTYFVYILASRRNGTLYIGITSDLARRMFEHKSGAIPGFTRRYRVNLLVYYEAYEEIGLALQRERNLKRWNRQWKVALIEKHNPDWRDLHEDLNK